MLVNDFLQNSARRFPDKVALAFEERRWTYAQLESMANRVANALLKNGVERGDRVVIFLPNCPEVVVSIFAILKAGAVFSVVNHSTKPDKLIYILNNCRAKALVVQTRQAGLLSEISQKVPSLKLIISSGQDKAAQLSFEEILGTYPDSQPPRTCIDVDLAALIYTSGSTGQPKGVMSTHLNMIAASTSITQYLENVPSDIILNVLPLSFDYGLYQVLMAFQVGAKLVLERGFVYPYAVVNLLEKERVTGFPGVPTIFARILSIEDKDLKAHDFSALRYITNTGASLPVSHIRQLRETFPQTKIYSMYGLTECKRVSYLPPEEIDRRPTSVGKAIPNTEVYIVNEKGERVRPGEIGELVVRGSHVMRGYWEMPEETEKTFRPGPYPGERVLYTGDLFTMDEKGFLYFKGRRDDLIKSRGEKVYPKEVENVLYSMEGVLEAAVIGVPDEVLGQAVKAVIVPRDGVQLNEREVIRFCAERLEDFMVPAMVEFRAELPKTTSGKIQKSTLH
ncbi:MAG: class I adenylate-forming enzyme family protein [Anaerolineae bacterium]